MEQILNNVYMFEDTCNVYVIKNESRGVIIDFGSGSVLDELSALGITHIEAVLVTHHHRDQVQGLYLAEQKKIPVIVPHAEQDLVAEANQMWNSRGISNNYNNRQDRFSILESVPITETLKDYTKFVLAGYQFYILPTPGHTTGSISIIVCIEEKKYAFTGDLLHSAGKVWSLAATQWSYNGGEGIPFSILSLMSLADEQPELILPSHGRPMDSYAITPTIDNLSKLLLFRRHNPRLFELAKNPYEKITEHLLFNRTSMSNSYVLLSRSGKALIFDFGYDFVAGIASGTDRSSRRPWLYTIPVLFKDYGVKTIDACLPTHYHDDHLAGFNLLRDTYGTKVLCPENFADILENPSAYDIPCLWYDPILVDQRLPLSKPFFWEEYELTLHPLSGHTRYSVAIEFTVDSKKVLCGGDQYADEDGLFCNYVYKNMFSYTDFCDSAHLYAKINPDIIITGHWKRFIQDKSYLTELEKRGKELLNLHTSLLPYETFKPLSSDFCAVFYPYRVTASTGESINLTLDVTNPFTEPAMITASLVLPPGFQCKAPILSANSNPQKTVTLNYEVTVPNTTSYRLRIGCDITIGGKRLGQQAEMLVTVNS